MPVKLGTISGGDFGGGIDAQSPPNRIPDGYIEDALNADPKPTGAIAKRRGYQGYAGYLPVRVERIDSIGTNLTFQLNGAMDLASIRSTPIIAMGRSSNSTGGDVTTSDSTHYYSGFSADIRTLIGTGTQTTTITQSIHDISSASIWVGAAYSSAYTHLDNTIIYPSQVAVNKTTYDISLTTVNGTGSSFPAFIYYADRAQSSTLQYFGNTTTPGATQSLPAGTSTFSIPLATHQLTSNLILAKVFHDDGTSYVELEPDAVVINKLSRQVDITLTNGTGSAINIIFSLIYAPASNYKTGAVATGTTNTVTIDLSTFSNRTNFVFTGCYLDNGVSFTQVIPNSIVIDSQAATMQVTFVDSGAGGANFAIYWQFVSLTIKKLTVQQATSATYTDTRPQVTLWGLPHDQIYATDETGWSKAWVTHLDSYRAAGESRMVSGLGGNLFAARQSTEGNYLMPTFYPDLQALVQSDTTISPAFWDTGEVVNRTRGYITGSTGASNSFEVKKVEWDSGVSKVKYTLSVPSISVIGTLSTIISTGAIKDKLTVLNTSYSVHNGVFPIHTALAGVNELYLWVANSKVDSADYDILGAGGTAGIFTDQLTLSANPFIIGDKILNDLFAADVSIDCYATSGNTVGLDNVVELHGLPTGLKILAERSSSVIPIRALDTTKTVSNIVMGDMLSHSEVDRKLRVLNINELADINISIAAGDGTLAQVTLLSSNTDSIWEGEKILVRAGATYQGVFQVASVDSATQFTIESAYTDADTAVMVGRTIQVDEILTYRDSTISSVTFSVDERWIPVEAPDDSFTLTPTTYVHHFAAAGYTDQNFLRSSMVKSSLYLTNGEDEVFKFDGTNLYRAGLPRWNPAVSISVDTTAIGKIAVDNPSAVTTSTSSANIFHLALADEVVFKVGNLLKHSLEPTARPYTVVEIKPDSAVPATKIHVAVDRNIGNLTSGGTLTRVSRFKYYFRLNAIDANNSITKSAAVGLDDHVVEVASDAAVRIKMVGMPVFDMYDFDNIDIEIHRTKAGTIAPFYKVATLPVLFDQGNGSISYVDTASDQDLLNLDKVTTALEGAELGTGWNEPIKAKYITSAAGKLLLGNLTEYPRIDIQLKKNVTLANADFTGKKFLIRKSNTDTGTTTDMASRANYEFRDVSTAGSIISATLPNTTTLRITATSHGLVAGNWVYLFRDVEGDFDNRFSGWWMIKAAAANTFDIEFANTGSAPATTVNKYLFATSKVDIPIPIGTDGNYGVLNGNTQGTLEFKAMKRFSDAVNSSMRQVNTQVTGMSSFVPWILAHAGSEFQAGQIILQEPQVQTGTDLEVKLPSTFGNYDLYVNNIRRSVSEEVSAITPLHPSRIIVSYANFPEIFGNPTALQDINSDSAIDINPADGQEITAIIPFFGDSAFGGAQQSGVVVVFKTNSIYLVDLTAKDTGTNAVQKIESQGKGCTAPFSVTVTRDGIMFANNTGVYRLNRSMQIDYIGRKLGTKFTGVVDREQLWNAHGHHDHINNKYKLSVVGSGQTAPDTVLVYDHVREYESQSQIDGSWTLYDNHKSIGWANLNSNSYFAGTTGRVFQTRQTGQIQDYRDDGEAIDMSVTLKSMDFGDSGIRKFVKAINTHYRGQDAEGTTLKVALDMVDNFDVTDSFRITSNADTSGISDTGSLKVETIMSTIDKAKGVYFQLKYENSTIDEPLEIVGVDFRVAGLNEKGIRQAPGTTR